MDLDVACGGLDAGRQVGRHRDRILGMVRIVPFLHLRREFEERGTTVWLW